MRTNRHASSLSSDTASSDVMSPGGLHGQDAPPNPASSDVMSPGGLQDAPDTAARNGGTAEAVTGPRNPREANPARETGQAMASLAVRGPVPGAPLAGRLAGALMALAGLWVAISPWFLTLQVLQSRNAAGSNLVIGLAVAVIGLVVSLDVRAWAWSAAGTAAGAWLIIAPFILAARYAITASMYWSNIWAGAVVIVTGLGLLAAARAPAAR